MLFSKKEERFGFIRPPSSVLKKIETNEFEKKLKTVAKKVIKSIKPVFFIVKYSWNKCKTAKEKTILF